MTDWDKYLAIAGIVVILLVVATSATADEMTHKFKNPSFSGVGTSSHYLTIENQEATRKQAIKDEIQALKDEIEREKDNTVEARFMRNLTSRIYANLARQIEDNLFGETKSNFGSMVLEGNTIEYEINEETVTVRITDEEGNVTEISVPVGSFTF
jgi:maltose-binding protein MalE